MCENQSRTTSNREITCKECKWPERHSLVYYVTVYFLIVLIGISMYNNCKPLKVKKRNKFGTSSHNVVLKAEFRINLQQARTLAK